MLESLPTPDATRKALASALPLASPRNVGESDLRHARNATIRWLALTLDQIGRGVVLLQVGPRVLHANQIARLEFDPEHPLKLEGGELRAREPSDDASLQEALSHADGRGLRRMLTLGVGPRRVTVAVLPLALVDGSRATLVSLPRSTLGNDLALACFARCQNLTSAETSVLESLHAGAQPAEIAICKGVRLSTVRTQIGSIRTKTGVRSIRELLALVAALPPMMPVMHPGGDRFWNGN